MVFNAYYFPGNLKYSVFISSKLVLRSEHSHCYSTVITKCLRVVEMSKRIYLFSICLLIRHLTVTIMERIHGILYFYIIFLKYSSHYSNIYKTAKNLLDFFLLGKYIYSKKKEK